MNKHMYVNMYISICHACNVYLILVLSILFASPGQATNGGPGFLGPRPAAGGGIGRSCAQRMEDFFVI